MCLKSNMTENKIQKGVFVQIPPTVMGNQLTLLTLQFRSSKTRELVTLGSFFRLEFVSASIECFSKFNFNLQPMVKCRCDSVASEDIWFHLSNRLQGCKSQVHTFELQDTNIHDLSEFPQDAFKIAILSSISLIMEWPMWDQMDRKWQSRDTNQDPFTLVSKIFNAPFSSKIL